MAKTKHEPGVIQWRASGLLSARGKVEGLRQEVRVSFLHTTSDIGIYLGGALQDCVPKTRNNGDVDERYELAKARAQKLVPQWIEREKAEAAKREAQERAEAEKRAADEAARGVAQVARERAEAFARRYLERGGSGGYDEETAEFARDVLRALGYPVPQ